MILRKPDRSPPEIGSKKVKFVFLPVTLKDGSLVCLERVVFQFGMVECSPETPWRKAQKSSCWQPLCIWKPGMDTSFFV
jgi:hypothetical protein